MGRKRFYSCLRRLSPVKIKFPDYPGSSTLIFKVDNFFPLSGRRRFICLIGNLFFCRKIGPVRPWSSTSPVGRGGGGPRGENLDSGGLKDDTTKPLGSRKDDPGTVPS